MVGVVEGLCRVKGAGDFHRFAPDAQRLLFDFGVDSEVALGVIEFHLSLLLLPLPSQGGRSLTPHGAGPLASRIQLRLSFVLRLFPVLSVLINEDL